MFIPMFVDMNKIVILLLIDKRIKTIKQKIIFVIHYTNRQLHSK